MNSMILHAFLAVLAMGPVSEASPAGPTAVSTSIIRHAQARQNLSLYVRAGDYFGVQGRVFFELVVSPQGRVTACRVERSSGSAALDDKTCQIMLRRARFSPARDAQGAPVEDRATASIGWFESP